MDRRTLLKASAALSALGLSVRSAFAGAGQQSGEGDGVAVALDEQSTSFDYDWLKSHARELAGSAWQDTTQQLPDTLTLNNLDPREYSAISYAQNHALWSDLARGDLQVQFFHVGMQFNQPVRMYSLVEGQARQIHFLPELFTYGDSGVDVSQLEGHDLGFAGWRVSKRPDFSAYANIVAFLGATYFRAIDSGDQFGLSARGLSINTAVSPQHGPEEFPYFRAFWFEQPAAHSTRMTVYALLDSQSATGAYRFDIDMQQGRVVMGIDVNVYPREPIERLGIAPMTSMFLTGTSQRMRRDTIVPLIHDSDRLSIWTAEGEWICRPLYNPETLQYNIFRDHNPRGFGLVQDDHEFANYRDPVNYYSARPSLWCEPTNDWGEGGIVLLELPTLGETVDNIGAFWQPSQPVEAGQALHYSYNLYWSPRPPVKPSLGQVDKTWSGMGAVRDGWIPGEHNPETWAKRFAIDFRGEPIASMPDDADIGAVISASRGETQLVSVTRLRAPLNMWRAQFDWYPQSDSVEPVTLRLYLQQGDQTLSETWLYQFVPPAPANRNWNG
ncbi:glucan biosynthesis protein [Kushneria aurantia]|uniref:Glucan biosynthesis protein n=1 Tax=Kushneria aurantia TaxID=504092 RepID=A0ABV6G090_9GAMM|nr:glucan biosynthesis protein D [Kushneria aurantia]